MRSYYKKNGNILLYLTRVFYSTLNFASPKGSNTIAAFSKIKIANASVTSNALFVFVQSCKKNIVLKFKQKNEMKLNKSTYKKRQTVLIIVLSSCCS